MAHLDSIHAEVAVVPVRHKIIVLARIADGAWTVLRVTIFHIGTVVLTIQLFAHLFYYERKYEEKQNYI